MRKFLCLAVLFVLSCAEGSVDDDGIDGTDTPNNGGRADCIAGVTCADPDCIDNDGDGFGVGCVLGTDCDDNDAQAAPNASETCDQKDNNCNGRIDENDVCSLGPNPNNTDPNPNNTTPPPNSNSPDCMDVDGDGYGVGCPAGGDCDENDPDRFEGAPEACDNKDNDCDGTTDEGFDVGMSCTAGLGVCERAGMMQCSADGTTDTCSANAGSGSAEVCDNLDNDCNGMVDDGINCTTCIEDGNEPDNSSGTGTTVNPGGSLSGTLCPSDSADWFRLGNYSAGQTVTVTAEFSHAQGDIELEMYVGATFEAGSYSGTDDETISRSITQSGQVTVRVIHAGSPPVTGTPYTIRR